MSAREREGDFIKVRGRVVAMIAGVASSFSLAAAGRSLEERSLIAGAMELIRPSERGNAARASMDALRWKARILVVPKAGYSRQFGYLVPEDLRERNVVIMSVDNRGIVSSAISFGGDVDLAALWSDLPEVETGPNLGLDPGEAGLFGKDGTLKATWHGPVEQEELNAVIDAMPMRMKEMRQN